jgi:hypothetical protein
MVKEYCMCLCDVIETAPDKLTEDQLEEHRFDLTMELAFAAREMAEIQARILGLSKRAEEVDLEFEAREAKTQGKMN